MTERISYLALAFLFPLLTNARQAITLHFVNDSGSKVFAQFVHPETGEVFELNGPDDPCKTGSITNYNSFANDELIFYETGDDCPKQVCRRVFLSLPSRKAKDYDSDDDEESPQEGK